MLTIEYLAMLEIQVLPYLLVDLLSYPGHLADCVDLLVCFVNLIQKHIKVVAFLDGYHLGQLKLQQFLELVLLNVSAFLLDLFVDALLRCADLLDAEFELAFMLSKLLEGVVVGVLSEIEVRGVFHFNHQLPSSLWVSKDDWFDWD
jgi:hypothetical protein